jgi:hypothetical protein
LTFSARLLTDFSTPRHEDFKTPKTDAKNNKRAAHEVSGIRTFARTHNRLLRARLFHDLANFPP